MTLALHDHPDWQQPLFTADLEVDFSNNAVNAGASFSSGFVDARAFSSIVGLLGGFANGVFAAYFPYQLVIEWFNTPSNIEPIWVDSFRCLGRNAAGGAFIVSNGQVMVATPVLGPYVRVAFVNNAATAMTMQGTLIGSSRTIAGISVQETASGLTWAASNIDTLLVNASLNTAAGVTTRYPMRLAPGRVWIRMEAVTTPHTFLLVGADGVAVDQIVVAAGTIVRQEMVFPRQSMRWEITNNGAGAGTHSIRTIANLETR